MEKLNSSGMRSTLDNLVLQQKVPVLGVCVGFQIMLIAVMRAAPWLVLVKCLGQASFSS